MSEKVALVLDEHSRNLAGDVLQRGRLLLRPGPACDHDLVGRQVARAQLEADGDAAELVVDDPPAERDLDAVVELGPHADALELVDEGRRGLGDSLARPRDEDHDLDRREPRRHAKAVIVAVDHDHRSDQASRGAP